ncbi:alpha/beta hydrolase fold protein [Rippkaea orientalis PCC 8801]|uniref:Alpha/beta hydrolase fold protein n=1 Tax=Rippkaea orientalis (strain PCC 8801 / RF-1) TaxID=41431 RepID=B7JYL3_RIPO1|nr:alpha/beta fold hydrolase [Rippkaea orientalis]ACK64883.1 alpha/beta hydrolase fold protein [Rippkaea orientalis PCC 8801]
MLDQQPWEKRIGRQRDWIWQGWQIRYSYLHCPIKSISQQKPPLILLHGFGAAIEHWRHNIPILAEKHSVYALDLLGFGGSQKAAADYSAYLWAQQVYDFWRTFIRQPVILVGNSIGSLVCLTVAATYPEMVAGIAMLSLPDVSLRQEMMPRWLQPIVTSLESLLSPPFLIKGLLTIVRRPSIIRPWVTLAYCDRSAITDELVEIISLPAYDQGAARTLCLLVEGARNPKFAPSAKAILPNLTIPMLLIWGKQDRFIPPSLAPMFAQLNSRITLVELDQVGHCPQDESPDRFNPILLDWIDSKVII